MTVFGTIVTGEAVTAAALSFLRTWSPTYIAEVARQSDRVATALPPFRTFTTDSSLDLLTGGQLPACIVVSPAIVEKPQRRGDGTYSAVWGVGVGVVVTSTTKEGSLGLASLYAAAVRAAFLQHQSLGGFASGVEWEDERYDEIGSEDTRTMAAAIVQFSMKIDSVLDGFGGVSEPPVPATEEPPELPDVDSVVLSTGVI